MVGRGKTGLKYSFILQFYASQVIPECIGPILYSMQAKLKKYIKFTPVHNVFTVQRLS